MDSEKKSIEDRRWVALTWVIATMTATILAMVSYGLRVTWQRVDTVREKDRQHEARIAHLEGQMHAVLESIQHSPGDKE